MFSKSVDRGMVRLIATKRIATGLVSLAAGFAGVVMLLGASHAHTAKSMMLFAAFVAITFGGGTWSLRDGLRLRRLLMSPAREPF